jgi:hypothetical protein
MLGAHMSGRGLPNIRLKPKGPLSLSVRLNPDVRHPHYYRTKLKIMKRILYICAFLVVLTGCAAKSIPKNSLLSDESKEGIVVLSVSHDLAGRRGARAIFHMDGGAASGGNTLLSLDEVIPGTPRGSEFKDSYGHLLVLLLPPGKHMIDSWQITNGTGLRIFPREKPTPLVFEVISGQVKYLGNLHANLATGKNIFGITITGDGYPEVRDQQRRDILMFENRYPQFSGKVVIDMLRLGPWLDLSDTDRRLDPVPVIPIKK